MIVLALIDAAIVLALRLLLVPVWIIMRIGDWLTGRVRRAQGIDDRGVW